MTGGLRVEPAQLRRAGADLRALAATLTAQVAEVERDLTPLVASWQGEARAAFDHRQARWQRAAAALAASWQEFGARLEAAADDYHSTERRNAARF